MGRMGRMGRGRIVLTYLGKGKQQRKKVEPVREAADVSESSTKKVCTIFFNLLCFPPVSPISPVSLSNALSRRRQRESTTVQISLQLLHNSTHILNHNLLRKNQKTIYKQQKREGS